MKKIAIFGGSFSPCHIGHIQVPEVVLDFCKDIDEVWLMPCNNSLYGKDLEDGEKRIGMCEVACQSNPRIKVCDWEIRHNMTGATYEIMDLLSKDPEYHDCEFSFIIGGDNALKTDTWVEWEYLESHYRFIVVPRQGIDFGNEDLWFMKPPHVLVQGYEVAEISSTEIRNALYHKRKYDFVNKHMDPKVLEYILFNSMYIESKTSGDIATFYKEANKVFK
jgi:nicotinate-nucleotide adenylyltransferase